MQITDKITLNLSGEEIFAPIVAHQGDLDSRVVECTLQKDGLPYTIEEGTTARATYRAASGVSDIHDAEIVGNAVVVPLIPSFLASPGTAHCDVLLSKGGAVVGTGRFAVLVSPAAAVGQDLEKSPEYQSFVSALADADQWKADTAEAISKATEATEGANAAAQGANAAASSVDAAKQAALDAAQSATAAAGSANTAASGADTAKTQAEEAAQSAQTAAARANEAADGIESTGIIAHMASTSNPHQVTAEQAGAMSSNATIELTDATQTYDLNNYWTPGQVVYIRQNVIDGKKVANCPSGTSGVMSVEGTSVVAVQTYIDVAGGAVYTRHKALSTGNMSGWGQASGMVSETTSNGSYIKWPDGTMECWGQVSGTSDSSGYLTVTFPVAFATTPTAFLVSGVSGAGIVERGTLTATQGKVGFRSYVNGDFLVNQASRAAAWHAIGRWK